jgi:2-polyprenyl-3-methyl-5-hydroxy-6-metoxy-1,4-benzoquinol methylase
MQSNLPEGYGWINAPIPESCTYVAPFIMRSLSRLSLERVLDLGCGDGTLCSILHSRDFDVVGVEYDQDGHDIALSRFPSIPFYRFGVQDDPKELLQSEARFDVVVSTEVVEHLYSPHLLVSYSREVLNDGGYLLVTTPYHGYIKNLALSLLDKWDFHHTPLWHGGHIKFWSRKTLSRLLEDNGFRVVAFFGIGRVPFLWKSMALLAVKV